MLGNLVSGSRDMGYLTPVRSLDGRFLPISFGRRWRGFFVGNAPEKPTLKMSMAPVGLDGCGSFYIFVHHVFSAISNPNLINPESYTYKVEST